MRKNYQATPTFARSLRMSWDCFRLGAFVIRAVRFYRKSVCGKGRVWKNTTILPFVFGLTSENRSFSKSDNKQFCLYGHSIENESKFLLFYADTLVKVADTYNKKIHIQELMTTFSLRESWWNGMSTHISFEEINAN